MIKPKHNKKQKINQASIVIMLVAVAFIVASVIGFYKGLKDVDLNYNYANIVISFYEKNIEINKLPYRPISPLKITDTGSDGISRPLYNYYRSGLNKMQINFLSGMVAALIFGLIVGGLGGNNGSY